MDGDRLRAIRLAQGVYLLDVGEPPVDGILVDRTTAAATWLAIADVAIASVSGDDIGRLIEQAARVYHRHVTAGINVAPHRSCGTA